MADGEVEIKVTFNADTGELEGLEDYIRSIRDEAEGTGDALNSMAMMQAGQALEQYGTAAESAAQNLNTANIGIEQLATTAGQSTDQVRSMIQSITNETFNYEEATAFSTALTQMGTNFENLGAQATNLDKLNDSFHLGTQGTIQLANEMNVLGVSADNMESSFNALAYANSNTIGGMSQFKTMMQRFNVDMRDSGLNIDQAAVAISAATHKFGGGRAAMTNFSNALKTANGDLSILEQELGLQPGALSNASAATGQYAGTLDELAQAEMNNKTIGERLSALWTDIESQNHAVAGSAYEIVSGFGMIAGAGMQLNGLIQLINTLRAATVAETIANYASTAAHYISAGATQALSVAQGILNAVMSMNPIFLVVIALVALAAALIWAYQNVDWFREMVNNAFATLQRFGQFLVSNISSAVSQFASTVQGIPKALEECLNWASDIVMSNPLVQKLQWLGDQAVKAFSILGLGQGSPGKIVGAMENELNWTQEAIEKHDLANTTKTLGADMASGFNPSLGVNGSTVSGASGNNITINIESVDSQERINQIVQAVEDALKFDNLKAGRTV